MRILYWTPEYTPDTGGVDELSCRVLPRFRERGHEFIVVTGHGDQPMPDVADINGIPVHRFRFREAVAERDLKQIVICQEKLARLKREFEPDLVHFHFSEPSGFFELDTAPVHRAPCLVTLDLSVGGYDLERSDTMIGTVLENAAWVAAVSESALLEARTLVPAISARSSVIYNALEPSPVEPTPLPYDSPTVLCLGRLTPEKGFDLAITAFKSVHERFPGSRLLLAGSGRARVRLEEQVRELGLRDAVRFRGFVAPSAVPELMNSASIVVLPSRGSEPFPLVALEAAQMARPVVASRGGSLPELVSDGETGILVDVDDPYELAAAITGLLEDPYRAMLLGNAGRQRVEGIFGLERYVDDYDRLYRELAGQA